MNVVEVRNFEFSYHPNKPVLRGVDFSVEQGSVVGLLGRNGAGKTTLLRSLLGLMRPGGGELRVFGLDPVRHAAEVKARVGYVSEDQVLPGHLTVNTVIRMFEQLFSDWDGEFANELIDRFRLSGTERISSLSKGQARQVALLCAVAHRPELLILDEPGAGIDPAMRRGFLETAIDLLARSGSTILFSSHYVTDVERLAGRIVVLDEGRVALDAELDALKEGHCVVRADADETAIARLRQIPGCLRARMDRDSVHAVFAAAPDALQSELSIASPGAIATRVSLEDLFIELVGRES